MALLMLSFKWAEQFKSQGIKVNALLITGQLINHKRELVQPAASEIGFAQLKNIFGSGSYPQYATDPQNIEKIWRLSTALIEE
ncbi:hypothetical protein MHI37_04335 [Paenibacillus sp. FSL H8-0548]|uniref:hypothetical protein n=1 Tax=Paenibacillus sp. FSL H8-0548 TaxID=1920422 RepID=UPI002115DDA9|nr:hypothetical protein [Paenibacillus sp. FSL H8-0548]